jgi:hypothetical protein
MAAIQTHTVIESLLPLGGALVARVVQPSIGLQQEGGSEVLLAVPPVGGAGCGAAGAQDAFVESVELFAVGGGLSVFFALGFVSIEDETDYTAGAYIGGLRVALEVWLD